ncbi:MinD/ParA family ATP-binding protein [Actinoplanes sp. HUAS TT8]|uniref:MinD/ParA family ATP-binding protein n=1 Tax=Actinoplanes sp. HUAS TT8 TaxID=3447453 RepID=UPI003F527ADC
MDLSSDPRRTEAQPPTVAAWQASAAAPIAPEPVTPETADEPAAGPQPAERPAQWGWRGRANRLSNGLIHLPARPDELVHRAARKRLLRPFSRTMTIVVANPKGGAAKTPTSLLAAATLGFHRGGYTLAWDNNETRGTLGMRAEQATHQQTVIDLLRDIDGFLSTSASVGRLSGYLRPQSARFDVLASDDVPGSMEIIDDQAFGKLWTALSRYYRLLVIDTGNNVRAPNWRAATSKADCLVVPTTVQQDVADSGLWMLNHLIRSGHEKLAANAVAVISCADPKTDAALLDDIAGRYRAIVREVVVIPHDPYIRSGGRMAYDALADSTRRAWLLACTAVVDSLSIRDQD